ELVPGIDTGVVRIIERALEKEASSRYQDADEMRIAFANVRQQLETSSNPAGAAARNDVLGTTRTHSTSPLSQPSRDAVAVTVLTPSPGRRTDREALIRRRAAQIDTGLSEARALLAAGNLEAAQTACEKVLTIDETNAQAVELYRSIERARARQG